MFKKAKVNKNKIRTEETDLSLHEELNENNLNSNQKEKFDINKIKSEIDKKSRKIQKGVHYEQTNKDDIIYIPFKKEETRESTVKKVFVSEIQLKEAKNVDEQKKLLGVKREEVDRIKEEKKKGLIEMQKELFTLPKYLEAQPMTKSDHVDNLLRLSTAGLIEVPLSLEHKLKDIEDNSESITNKSNINLINNVMDNKVAEELDYLKVMKKLGPSYAIGYKSDISSKKLSKLKNVFENVFVPENSRKRKLFRERVISENRKMEE